MSNCYPQRKLKTGKVQKSLCENCINKIEIKFIKTSPFWSDDLMEAAKEIEQGKVNEHDQGCKYLNLGRSHYHNIDCIVVTECNQYKPDISKLNTANINETACFKTN